MKAATAAFTCAKAGNLAAEYEDAVSPRSVQELSGSRVRVAVADGATEGIFSGMWAECLTDAWAKSSRAQPHQIPAAARSSFGERVASYLGRREADGRPIAWYEMEKLSDGAYATFVGLTLRAEGQWHAAAVGDSCVFQIRDGRRIASFPLTKASDFDSTPSLLRSTGGRPRLDLASGAWQPSDSFLLCTDAFAQWLLADEEAGRTGSWQQMLDMSFEQSDEFLNLVSDLRKRSLLKNDDVTMLRLLMSE